MYIPSDLNVKNAIRIYDWIFYIISAWGRPTAFIIKTQHT